MSMKKTLAGIASYALVGAVAMGVGGTLATLNDETPTIRNTMTDGKVRIEQLEQERVSDKDDAQHQLQPFTQNKQFIPAFYDGTSIPWAKSDEWVTANDEAWKVVDDNPNVLDKFVTVTNTGDLPAYVRTVVAVEVGTDKKADDYIHAVVNDKDSVKGMGDWTWAGYDEIDGATYAIGYVTYLNPVQPNETTVPSLKQFYLDKEATEEIVDSFGGEFEVLVVSQAVQTGTVDEVDETGNITKYAAEVALDTAFGKIAEDNHPWVDGIKVGFEVSNDAELAAAIAAGETEIWLNAGTYHAPSVAKGKTLTLNGTKDSILEIVPAGQSEAGGQLDYNFDGSTVTFNGITIKTNSQLYAGYARMSGTYNDCVIQNTYNLGANTVNAFNNCEINISNEYLRVGGAASAEFNNCTFNTDGRAILVFQDGTHVAQTVTVKDCTFNATAAAKTWNGIHVAAVSIDGTNGTYTVNLEGNNTVDSDFNGLWQIKTGETNVTVNE